MFLGGLSIFRPTLLRMVNTKIELKLSKGEEADSDGDGSPAPW